MVMVMVAEEDEERRPMRDRLEETFRRYEAEPEEPPPAPRIAAARPVAVERPRERIPRVEIAPPRVVRTGIPGMDGALEGGLPERSLLLITGEPGSHHTTFAHQVLYNHAFEKGKVAYYTLEVPSIDVREEMAAYGWYIQDFIPTGQWVFVSALTPDLQRLAEIAPQEFFQGGLRVPLSRSLNALKTDLLNKIREDRWTVLPLSHLLHHFDFREVTDLVLYWRLAIRTHGGVHLALLPTGVHDPNHVNELKHLADGVLEFMLREGPRGFDSLMVVRKLRGTLRRARLVPFTVAEDGIAVETAARIA